MRTSGGRVVVVAAACLVWLSGCETSTKLTGLFSTQRSDPDTTASIENPADPAEPATTGSVLVTAPQGPVAFPTVNPTPNPVVNAANPRMLGKDPYDDLSLGKKYFRSANFGLAEKHFRRAVELHPRDAEAWVGLAASYDRLKRFDLSDRAYGQAASIIGETPELMNNRGFSYILRGDYARARRTLEVALAKAPDNPYIRNNLELLEKVQRRGKAIN
jgi:tetratricopeptide (TPR) repeat protein